MDIKDEQLIDILEGNSNPTIEKEIAQNAALQKRYFELKEVLDTIQKSTEHEVPLHLKGAVQQAIIEEQSSMQRAFGWAHIAAAVLILLLGFSLGRMGQSSPVDGKQELAALRNEIISLKEATLTGSLKRYSASDRILAVNQIKQSEEVNPELLATLVTTLNSDESPNVRYAALQALSNYLDIDQVRYELVKSLETQTDPLIQISLINILVEAEEKSARVPMKNLIEEEETLPEVKEQVEIALKVLI